MALSDETTGQVDERFSRLVRPIITLSGTTATVGATYIDAYVVSGNAGAVTVTIPESTADAGKVFPVGTQFRIFTKGAGTVTVAKTGSDVLTGTATIAQNATKVVTKVAATEWQIG
jgi:DNA-binding beta-propeller fold protein YncE